MIRTAEQILADIAASGGEVGEDDDEPDGRCDGRTRISGSAGSILLLEPARSVKMCAAPGCPNLSPSRRLCSTHKYRLKVWGHYGEDIPIRTYGGTGQRPLPCGCCVCPGRVVRRERPKVEQVGDVWLAVIV